ncbi:ABC transporter substrate-binding protein ['Santalum album' aster yellows phytoplasma]|uniref:ABC transporter substrate-binding protein n=1 Tax='Santalum album' aster yellows phytoplasma TaxID=2831467 RepID=A0ABS5LL39_9MOLU|nr:ABC transporter substrate-binding protein ['Santalum album' aster yellows phytoplasma]MBS2993820.1 ABC transporter substrate-binding protein ['Santalum album' aster yellows phytoplasma]
MKNYLKKQNTKYFIVGFVLVLITVFLSYIVYQSFQKENYDLIEAFNADIKGLDPTKEENTITTVGNNFFRHTHDTLLEMDGTNFKKKLAKDFKKEGTKITFELRENLYFHNGEKLSFEDVEYSIQKGIQNGNKNFQNIEKVNKLDNNKFEVILKKDYLNWSHPFTNYIRILNKKAVEKNYNEGIKIGTGPYKLKKRKEKESISLELFDKYYDKDFCSNGLKKILIKIIEDPNTALTQLEQGKIDAIIGYPSAKINDLKARRLPNIKIIEQGTFTAAYCYINAKNTDEETRKAIIKAVDVPKYIQELKLPVNPLESSLPPGLIGYDEKLKHHPTNIEDAKNIVKKLSLEEKKLKLYMSNGGNKEMPKKITEALKAVGFETQLEEIEFNTLLDKVKNKNENDTNILFLGENFESLFGNNYFVDYYLSDSKIHCCHINDFKINDHELEKMIKEAKEETNLDKYEEIVKKINQHIHDKFYIIPLTQPKSYNLTTNKIKQGFEADSFNNFDITKVKKE